jgi:hypothetical protein
MSDNPGNTFAGILPYRDCPVRKWLKNEWRMALINAGIPEDALFAPKRKLAVSYTEAGIIEDDVFLPTEQEMTGSATYAYAAEANSNPSRFSYYKDKTKYWKLETSTLITQYWLATITSRIYFVLHSPADDAFRTREAYNAASVIPCFCIA